MDYLVLDWLSMLGRWAHIITGIAWIGSSFFFMWLDSHMADPEQGPIDGVEGELFMVHGGGYYRVHKKPFAQGAMPKLLHWFKWEAYTTWITGFFTLGVIYYAGGGTFMLDPEVSKINGTEAILIGLFSLFGSWMIYDCIWRFLGQVKYLPILLTAALMIGMDLFLINTLSGRAAYIHMGAMLGTWMVGNVFVHIIPNQKKVLAAIENGTDPDIMLAKKAKQRSVQNNYFTLPVLFIMISNHHPMTYGNEYAWLILAFMFAGGAFIRHYFNLKNGGKDGRWALFPAALAITIAIMFTLPRGEEAEVSDHDHSHQEKVETKEVAVDNGEFSIPVPTELLDTQVVETNTKKKQVAPVKLGDRKISGAVSFSGSIPQNKNLKMPAACAKQHKGGKPIDTLYLVKNGMVQNVVVWIKNAPEMAFPVPTAPVEVDQRGCIYIPRVVATRAGQDVIFINSDPVFHNVKTISKQNKRFNSAMPRKDQRMTKVFNRPEFTVHAKCSLHPWMGAHIAVFDHPFFAVTDEKGNFSIEGLSPGQYEIGVWHEKLGEKTLKAHVKADQDLSLRVDLAK